jgi:hypothetical protein
MLPSSLVILFNIRCINATQQVEIPMYNNMHNNRANSIVALITCSVRNIACIAIKRHKQIDCSVSSVAGKKKLIENDIKYFLTYNK